MATKFQTTEKVGRSDLFTVAPEDVKPGIQARFADNPQFDEDVINLANSFSTVGQLQPIVCRKTKDGSLHLVFGNTRLAAAKLIRKGFTNREGQFYQDKDFQVQVRVERLSDEEAYDRAIQENHSRRDMTDLQEALAQDYYRRERKWTDTTIARFFGYGNQNRVMNLKKLLTLPTDVQQQVHKGLLSLSAAVEITKAPQPVQTQITQHLTNTEPGTSPPVTAGTVRNQTRQHQEANPSPEVNPQRRTVKDFKDFNQEIALSSDTDTRIQHMFATIVSWFAGEKTDRQLMNAVDKVQDLIPEKSREFKTASE